MKRPPADEPEEPAAAAGLLGEGLEGRIDRWAADARTDEAVRRRSRERWLRRQEEEEGRLAGVLADVAERGVPVTVHVRGGRRHRGEVRAVGRDFVAVRSATSDVMIALSAVTSVRTPPGTAPTTGARSIATPLCLGDVLAELAAERAAALVVTGDGDDAVSGTLRSVGHDVVVVRLVGDPPGNAYVALGAITEAVLRAQP